MQIGIVPYLNQIFPNSNAQGLNDILHGVSTENILKLASFVNGKLFVNDSSKTHREIFNTIIFQEGIENSEEINANMVLFEQKHTAKEIGIFPLFIILKLIEYSIINFNDKDNLENPQKELAFLKAVLFLHQEYDKKYIGLKYEKSIFLLWSGIFPQYEYLKQKNPINEMYVAFSLFDYLESRFPEYYANYLVINSSKNTKDMLKEILGLIAHSFNNENKLQACNFTSESFNKLSIISSFIRDISNFDLNNYIETKRHLFFKGLREKPVLRLHDKSFVVINWNYITDKIRQGVVFDFYNNSGINEKLTFDRFKSTIGKEYSEKGIFTFILNELYEGNPDVIMYSEDAEKNWNFDYYIRYNNKILLFEFKDVTISEDIKNSSGKRIWEELKLKFVENDKGKPKGMTQLANFIERLNSDPNSIENYNDYGLTKSNLIIMPILLYTDESCGIHGINRELAVEFRKKYKSNDFFFVYNPVMIGVNVIVEYLYHLKGSPQKLITLIHEYYLHRVTYQLNSNSSNYYEVFENSALSFDKYLAYRFGELTNFDNSISLKFIKQKLDLT